MKIKGKYAEYKVLWGGYGWTYSAAFVYEKRWFGWKKVWSESTSKDPERMYPSTVKRLFGQAVDRYEDYKDAWRNQS